MNRLVSTGIKKLGGFGSSTVANGLVGLVTIPFIVALAGPVVWGGIAVAQSIAGMAVVFVAFGWGVMGPARIAASRYAERGQLYVDSLTLRLILLCLVLPVTVFLITIWAPGNLAADILAGTATVIAGAGASWFFIGEGKPWRLFVIDTIPRCTGTLLGTLLLGITGDVLYLTVAQVAGSLFSVFIASVDILRRHTDYRLRESLSAKRQIHSFNEQLPGVLTAAASSMYMNAPLAILAGWAPSSVPVYAMADKITRFAVMAASPLTQIAQSAVPSPDADKQTRNIELATKISVAGAVTSGLVLAVAMPWGSQVLSAGKIEVGFGVSTAFGLTLAAIVVSQISGLVSLMALGRARIVAASVVLGLCIAVPLVYFLAYLWGATGAAWGLGASELAVALFQFRALKKILKSQKVSAVRPISDPIVGPDGVDLRN